MAVTALEDVLLQHLEIGSVVAGPLALQSFEQLRHVALHLCVLLHSRQLSCGDATRLRLAILLIEMLPLSQQPAYPSLELLRDPLNSLAVAYQGLDPNMALKELDSCHELPLFQEKGLNGIQAIKRTLDAFLCQRMEALHGNLPSVRAALASANTTAASPRLESREAMTPQPPTTPRQLSGQTRRPQLATSTTISKPHDWVL